eukprot:9600562-Alexandrium_andersonii.AAC.1
MKGPAQARRESKRLRPPLPTLTPEQTVLWASADAVMPNKCARSPARLHKKSWVDGRSKQP